MSIRTGDQAPAFALPTRPGEIVDVGEHLGRVPVVFLFFPLAFSSVCTEEMCAIRDDWSSWSELGAQVFGISVDSPFVAARFRQDESIPFPLLSDFNREVISTYGVLEEDFYGLKGVAKRSVIVVGADGRVIYDWVSDDAGVQVDFAAIKKSLE